MSSQQKEQIKGWVLRDEGKYRIIDQQTREVKWGTYLLDIRIAKKDGMKDDTESYELFLQILPNGKRVEGELIGQPEDVYKGGLRIWLWSIDSDPRGVQAEKLYKIMLQKIKSGIPGDQILSELNEQLSQLRASMSDSNKQKQVVSPRDSVVA